MSDEPCAPARSSALVAARPDPGSMGGDPILAGHLKRLAAASGCPSPHVLPGAAASVFCVHLPMKSARQRRAAFPFAAEPVLATDLAATQLALGPEVAERQYLCTAADQEVIAQALDQAEVSGPLLPDVLAVPPPFDPDAWSLWCGAHCHYLRFADGGALVVERDVLADLWRARGQPELHLWHGTPPVGVKIARRIEDPPDLDPAILKIDLRPASHRGQLVQWRRLARFSGIAAALTGVALIGLLHLDARALARIEEDRVDAAKARITARGMDPAQINRPAKVILAGLSRSVTPQQTADDFLTLLSRTAAGLAPQTSVSFRDLRFDHATGTLTVLITASDLGVLQDIETTLQAAGLSAVSGAAARANGNAEMQIVVRQAG